MQIAFIEEVCWDIEIISVRADIRERCLGGFLHNITNGPGHLEAFRAWHLGGFDEENFTAVGCPGQTDGHAGDGGTPIDLIIFAEVGKTQLTIHSMRIDQCEFLFVLANFSGYLAADRSLVSFQAAYAGFARVGADH